MSMSKARKRACEKQITKGNAPWQTRKTPEQIADNPGFHAPTYLRYRQWLAITAWSRFNDPPVKLGD